MRSLAGAVATEVEGEFWSRVNRGTDCWFWTGTTYRRGYGRFSVRNAWRGRLPGPQTQRAHRVAWTLVNGPIPAAMCVCHHCDTPPCVRPDHLFVGTVKDNNQDSFRKGRHPPSPTLFRKGRHPPYVPLAGAMCQRGHEDWITYPRANRRRRRCRICENASQRRRYHARRGGDGGRG